MSNPKRGFTLVELLVVVGIISILASIALPNFLEAQTRARVSRAKADIRTIVLALESYHVDYNNYPTYHYADVPVHRELEFHIGGKVPEYSLPDPEWNGANPITTPVAYVSRMPTDPFAWTPEETFRYHPSSATLPPGPLGPIPPEVVEYHYVNWQYAAAKCRVWRPVFTFMGTRYGPYRIFSRGPDRWGPDPGVPYDATNGTMSRGDIIYGQKNGFDQFFLLPSNL